MTCVLICEYLRSEHFMWHRQGGILFKNMYMTYICNNRKETYFSDGLPLLKHTDGGSTGPPDGIWPLSSQRKQVESITGGLLSDTHEGCRMTCQASKTDKQRATMLPGCPASVRQYQMLDGRRSSLLDRLIWIQPTSSAQLSNDRELCQENIRPHSFMGMENLCILKFGIYFN